MGQGVQILEGPIMALHPKGLDPKPYIPSPKL